MRRTAALTLLLAGALPAAAGPTVVLFESFESLSTDNFYTVMGGGQIVTDAATWTVGETSIDIVGTYGIQAPKVIASDGDIVLDINGSPGPGSIETLVTLDEGSQYELSFEYGHLLISDWATMLVEVFGDDDNVLLSWEVFHQGGETSTFSQTFLADSTAATLKFTGLDATNINGGVTIDAIQIVGVIPTPAAASLLGVAGLAGLRRRR